MHRHTISPEYLRAYVAPQYAPQCSSERRTTQLLRCSTAEVVEDHEFTHISTDAPTGTAPTPQRATRFRRPNALASGRLGVCGLGPSRAQSVRRLIGACARDGGER